MFNAFLFCTPGSASVGLEQLGGLIASAAEQLFWIDSEFRKYVSVLFVIDLVRQLVGRGLRLPGAHTTLDHRKDLLLRNLHDISPVLWL